MVCSGTALLLQVLGISRFECLFSNVWENNAVAIIRANMFGTVQEALIQTLSGDGSKAKDVTRGSEGWGGGGTIRQGPTTLRKRDSKTSIFSYHVVKKRCDLLSNFLQIRFLLR
jgi:hypothetical protein